MQPLICRAGGYAEHEEARVSAAAAALGIRVVDLFHLAHLEWQQRHLTEKELNRLFGAFLRRQQVPHWLRGYCRRVLNLAAAGQLDPRAFGVQGSAECHLRATEQRFAAWASAAGLLAYFVYLLLVR